MEANVILLKKNQENKLKMAPDSIKEFYSTIRNALCKYANVKERMMVNCDGYKLGKEYLAKITVSGKTIKLFLALDPNEYDVSKFHHVDVSDKKTYVTTPFMVKLGSKLAVKRAVSLIEDLSKKFELAEIEGYVDVDFLQLYPYIENAEFEKATKKTTKSKKATEVKAEEVVEEVKVEEVVEEVKAEEVIEENISDNEELVFTQEEFNDLLQTVFGKPKSLSKKRSKAVCNLEVLDEYFDNEEINLISLKSKGLISPNARFVKILGCGNVSKKHVIDVDAVSKSALKKLLSANCIIK